MIAYCVKCKAKREMSSARAVTMKNGKPATKGTCPVCGTGMYRIGKSNSGSQSGGSSQTFRSRATRITPARPKLRR